MDPEPSSFILLLATEWPLIWGILALFVLLLFSALISGSEVAFFSLSKTELDAASIDGSKKKNIVASQLERPQKLLATILISNNFINILIVLLFAYIGDYFFNSIEPAILRFVIEVIIVTFLILLFGEVLPKIYASRNPMKFATLMAVPTRVLNYLLHYPAVTLMGLTTIVEKRLGKKQTDFSVEKLSQALELTSEEATTKDEQKILEGIVSFGNTETVQVMCPRTDVFALAADEKFTVVVEKNHKKWAFTHSCF